MKRLTLALLGIVLAAAAARAAQMVVITPAPLSGYGTLAVLAASLPLSNATLGPNAGAFPTGNLPNQYIEVKNSAGSANTLYVCPLGGTCTTAAGIPLAVGESKTWMLNAANGQFTAPTVISGGTATALVSW